MIPQIRPAAQKAKKRWNPGSFQSEAASFRLARLRNMTNPEIAAPIQQTTNAMIEAMPIAFTPSGSIGCCI
jgi:hypothetical protein